MDYLWDQQQIITFRYSYGVIANMTPTQTQIRGRIIFDKADGVRNIGKLPLSTATKSVMMIVTTISLNTLIGE